MSDVVIRAEKLSKRYRIGERERYLALRDILARAFSNPFHWKTRPPKDYLWALLDVSFEIRQGEVIGLVGRNGAGKTTLLKLLSRITKPTTGSAEIHGRVGSLLEVGTGFHPELTGRENIYLSGAILGMRKREIDDKFDIIVAFAEVERFVDTPLKFFSTGMQMRLAFAVAAHLEPEILFVDEVLAVGDIEFQKKCIGKMQDVSHSGRTIVFVSHQTSQIRRLCERVFWIDGGQVRREGPTGEVLGAYESNSLRGQELVDGDRRCFLGWSIGGHDNVLREETSEVRFHLTFRLNQPIVQGHLGFNILNDAGTVVAGWGFDGIEIPAGVREIILRVPNLPLRPGAYSLFGAIFNRGNNLTGGELLEQFHPQPPLIVDTRPVAHPQDQYAGILNVPAKLQMNSKQLDL
jgi:ABC-type polysaccharide/polyol phosphate transport system ATPase subunit